MVCVGSLLDVRWGARSSRRPQQLPNRRKVVDGVYGRFDGDVDLSLAAGATVVDAAAPLRQPWRARSTWDGRPLRRLRRLLSGNFAAVPPPSLPRPRRPLRPFFLPRWSNDLNRGPAILDLTLDATTFDLGRAVGRDQDGRSAKPGSSSASAPKCLSLGQAAGPWLASRGALRWRASELASAESQLRTAPARSLFHVRLALDRQHPPRRRRRPHRSLTPGSRARVAALVRESDRDSRRNEEDEPPNRHRRQDGHLGKTKTLGDLAVAFPQCARAGARASRTSRASWQLFTWRCCASRTSSLAMLAGGHEPPATSRRRRNRDDPCPA